MKLTPSGFCTWPQLLGWLVGLLFLLGLPTASIACNSNDPAVPVEPGADEFKIDRALTIGDVTVELSDASETDDGLEIRHTYSTADPELVVHRIGNAEVLREDTSVMRLEKTVVESDNRLNTSFSWRKDTLGDTGIADVHLGFFIVSNPDITGSTQIPLGTGYSSYATSEGHDVELPLDADLTVGERRYRVTGMALQRESRTEGVDFSSFRLTVKPENDPAGITEMATGLGSGVTITDDAGSTYQWLGTRTRWRESPESRTVVWQEFMFRGAPPLSASSLTLSVTGGDEVVGPFLFESVRLVSEDGG